MVPRDETNSWWEKVGVPKSVEQTFQLASNLPKLRNIWKIPFSDGQQVVIAEL